MGSNQMIHFLAFVITFLKIHYEWSSNIKRNNTNKAGWFSAFLKKKTSTTHSLPLDFSLSPKKGIAHTSEMWSTRDTIYYEATSHSYCVIIVPEVGGSCFPHLIKDVVKFHLYEKLLILRKSCMSHYMQSMGKVRHLSIEKSTGVGGRGDPLRLSLTHICCINTRSYYSVKND